MQQGSELQLAASISITTSHSECLASELSELTSDTGDDEFVLFYACVCMFGCVVQNSVLYALHNQYKIYSRTYVNTIVGQSVVFSKSSIFQEPKGEPQCQ